MSATTVNFFRQLRVLPEIINFIAFSVAVGAINLAGVLLGQEVLVFSGTIAVYGLSTIASAIAFAVRLSWSANRAGMHLQELAKLKKGERVPDRIGLMGSILLRNLRIVQSLGQAATPTSRRALSEMVRSELKAKIAAYHASAGGLAALGLIGSFAGSLFMVQRAAAAMVLGPKDLMTNFAGVFDAMALCYLTSILSSYLGAFVLSGIATRLDAAADRFADALDAALGFATFDGDPPAAD